MRAFEQVGARDSERLHFACRNVDAPVRGDVVEHVAENVRKLQRVAERFGELLCSFVFEAEDVYRHKPHCRRHAVAVFAHVFESFERVVVGVAQDAVDDVEHVLARNVSAAHERPHFLAERGDWGVGVVRGVYFALPVAEDFPALVFGAHLFVGDVVHEAAEGVECFHVARAVFSHAEKRECEVRFFALAHVVRAFGVFGVHFKRVRTLKV